MRRVTKQSLVWKLEAHRSWIEAQVQLGRNAVSIYQDLVESHGFEHRCNSVKRFVHALRSREPERPTIDFRGLFRTHRSRSPDDLRLSGFCLRSNPHRSATLLIGISTSPRFPPWRLVQHLPPSLTGLGPLSAHRQVWDNP
jgi:hypothetical protein